MGQLPHVGDALAMNARFFGDRIGARDLERAMTFRQWHERSCRLANALCGIGLQQGDRVCVLGYNCIEWVEIYAAVAFAGLIAVPINFRLVGAEISYIVNDCGAKAIIVQDDLLDRFEAVRSNLPVMAANIIIFGGNRYPGDARSYEKLIESGRANRPDVTVLPEDPFTLMYTSGTTGRPKGAIRSHRSTAMLSLVTEVEMGLSRRDTALLVMPMCHANSLFFFGAFVYCGAACTIYSRKSIEPEHLLRTLAESGATFTSLVPTHYIMMLGLPARTREACEVGRMTKLMISSAPARRDTKLAIMEHFKNSGLFEGYGSTEAGWVTVLHPGEQFTKLGSVGRECTGSLPIKLLDPLGHDVPDGTAGELYSSNPYSFDGYWNLPEKTRDAIKGDYCTVGDLARRDSDGYIYLVDRKTNMIISGGENIYPSEVEGLLGSHDEVKDVAVIGIPDATWGECVHAVIVLHRPGSITEQQLLDWCRGRSAGHKRPRSVSFIAEADMPRTATGKILHRVLRDKYAARERAPGG